jgi:hypothetical protein
MKEPTRKGLHNEIYYKSEDGLWYQNGGFGGREENDTFPMDMKIGGIKKIVLRTRAYIVGVRFRAMRKRDEIQLESLMVFD